MGKTGIITFHQSDNFGAVLQALALQKTIEKLGYECEIVDYRCRIFDKSKRKQRSLTSRLKSIYGYLRFRSIKMESAEKDKRFMEFKGKYLKTSRSFPDAAAFGSAYDAIVSGSDQVWNPVLTQGDYTYFLPFQKGARKLSYAASFGKSAFDKDTVDEMGAYLKDFDSIIVRETTGMELLKQMGLNGKKALDPSLLLTKEEWLRYAETCDQKTGYILVYTVARQTNAIEYANNLAKEKGLSVLFMNTMAVGPGEFLYLVRNAAAVISTSFHGLIFAMNFNVPFLYELSKKTSNANSRLEEMAATFDLKGYEITGPMPEERSYDWDRINSRLAEERAKSIDLLAESLAVK